MKINLLSIETQGPDKRVIAQFIQDIAVGVNDSLAREFTEILLEGDAIEIEINNNNTASALRGLRKLNIDYEIIED
ncbi:hypothetical protein GO491_05575 [Flavobacteriaceae bacterium Ap0902]|nr:hypothetical protein [Flavobacteriaceae bacterium Ap0902]